ncbi:MAG: GNAT family N-acetyltransferase [Deltaproteobacteria bacterium]|nr:GNAT family N-acetyltransferase [Deltaproteobacteria bacterium]
MKQTIEIRPARAGDAGSLLQLIQALAEYERLAHEVSATEADLRATLFGERPGAEVLLAFDAQGAPIGYALFFPTYSTFLARPGLWLEDLFVLPEQRGRGVGRALLSRVAARAVALHPEGRLEWSVLDWNEPALRFYAALGARPLSDWTTQRLVGEDLHLLAGLDPSPLDNV